MPIVEKTARGCFDVFADHIRKLVASTISDNAYVQLNRFNDRGMLALAKPNGDCVPLNTSSHGRLYFYAGQALEAVADGDKYRLQTVQYWYKLQETASPKDPPALRWEYDRGLTGLARHCRHHFHAEAEVEIGRGCLDLNKCHTPTGWVTIEEMIRFLIIELGHVPPCGDRWPDELVASEKAFYESFTSKRYTPKPPPKKAGRERAS